LRSRDIAALLACGRRHRGRSLSVQVRANGLPIARLGLIISKRHLPRAVDRNRLKRLLREWFRLNQEALQGRDLLVRITGPVGRLETITDDVHQLVTQQ